MLKNKRAAEGMTINKIITIILVILVLVVLILAVFKFNIVGKFKDLFPEFQGIDETIIYSETCPVKIAIIDKDDFLGFCSPDDKECKSPVKSKIRKNGNIIEVDQKRDETIGQITRNVIIINEEIRNREGKLFTEVVEDLPDFFYVKNLHLASIYKDKVSICREKIVYEEIPENSYPVGYLVYWKSGYSKIYASTKGFGIGGLETGIYIDGTYLKTDYKFSSNRDTKIGEINNKKILIYPQYLSASSVEGLKIGTGYLDSFNGGIISEGVIYKTKETK